MNLNETIYNDNHVLTIEKNVGGIERLKDVVFGDLLVSLKLVPLGLRNQIKDIAVVWGIMEGEVAIEQVYNHDTGDVIWENHDGDWTDTDNILTSTLLMYGDLEQTIGELI
jgi:hypothetical protein|tara:strand:+ start:274 stop:606 length:333 start_codon:yes stop_codon:yes gene_type:complete